MTMKSLDAIKSELEEKTTKLENVNQLAKQLNCATTFIQTYFVENEIEFAPNGTVSIVKNGVRKEQTYQFIKNDLLITHDIAVRQYKQLANELKIKGKITPFLKDVLFGAFENSEALARSQSKSRFVQTLAYENSSDLSLLNKWVTAIVGKQSDLDVAVMHQWMWTVKRKMLGENSDYCMLPVVYSAKQQIGKTRAIECLTAPFGDYKIEKEVTEIVDPRHFLVYKDFYICILDELAGLQRAEAAELKRKITQRQSSGRALGQDKQQTFFVACSFIGTSNRGISSLINDHTGLARFWQINAAEVIDWAAINSIDYVALWKSVNPHAPAPIIPYLKDIRSTQEEFIVESAVKLFLDSISFDAKKPLTKFVSADSLYIAYQNYCAESGEKPLSKRYVGTQLRENGALAKTTNNVRGYLVNEEVLKLNKSKLEVSGIKALTWNQ